MTLPLGYIQLTQANGQSLKLLMDESQPTASDGFGGWTEIQRPHRDSLTEWQGIAPMKLAVGVYIDAFADNTSVEYAIAKLELMGSPVRDAKGNVVDDPPPISIDGPVPHLNKLWLLQGIENRESAWNDANDRTRQQLGLTFLEYKPGPVFGIVAPKNYRLYIIKQGDTPSKIALHQLKKRSRWVEIAKLNPKFKIRSANQNLVKFKNKAIRIPLR